MNNDVPKIWEEPTDEGTDISSAELMVIEEEPAPLTIVEQKQIVETADISDRHRGFANALIEMNALADVYATIQHSESQARRQDLITMFCENFVSARMQNNITAERLKYALLERLTDNIENLDLETVAKIYNDLTDVSSVDAQTAISNAMGGGMSGGIGGGSAGPSIVINNATSDGAMITTNTLNASGEQVQQLKEINNLAGSLKTWNNAPRITNKPE